MSLGEKLFVIIDCLRRHLIILFLILEIVLLYVWTVNCVIFFLMHNENSVVRLVTTYKLLCPRSTISDNYKYLCCKYRIAHADWNNNVNFLMKKICVEYTNHDYSVCNTVRELCDMI